MLLDANILLLAVDRTSPDHDTAASWLTDVLNGDRRVGLPWQTIGTFLRISTDPRSAGEPLDSVGAWSHVADWLASDPVWIPPATEVTAASLQRLLLQAPLTAELVPEAQLAALALDPRPPRFLCAWITAMRSLTHTEAVGVAGWCGQVGVPRRWLRMARRIRP